MKTDDRKNLRQAIKENDLEKLRELIATFGPNAVVYSKSGDTLLHYACYACEEENPDVVRILIEAGVDVDAKNVSGATALHIACFNGHVNSIRLLLEHGADVGIIDINDLTPFDDICQSRGDHFNETYTEIGDILIANGADINSLVLKNETNLHYACRNMQVNVVRFLLSRGADPTINDVVGRTPLDAALSLPTYITDREEILNLFREYAPEQYFSAFCTMNISL